MRKIIQIHQVPETEITPEYTMALCDDGSLWSYFDGDWLRIKDIPQDDQQEENQK
jgi:hypothetical protein